eukprot:TRINITY_DN102_c0_g1_i1.p1 TRINITY_DN102_c0_g1~~TRINITY_DN102_c0_g1_i1.p1  ORF type:complete len:514 (-),score=83.31 TRINITY_DN102_c0_g1_i1:20-1561(-)
MQRLGQIVQHLSYGNSPLANFTSAPGNTQRSDIGVVGLAVMGENLILNMASKGFHVSCFNRTTQKVRDFVNGRAKGKTIHGFEDYPTFVASLKSPRTVLLMVRAGDAVDENVELLLKYLDKGDIIIDGGNSNYTDTNRRIKNLQPKGIHFMGFGVSGGEEGALKGPSIMPGGAREAWENVKTIFRAISAKVEDGTPCCDYVGEGGAGHFVKMVHNGIEYGDMQLLAEAYLLMSKYLGLGNDEIGQVFETWNNGDLDSYLVEITRDIFRKKDVDGKHVVDVILDAAGQKGTGKWTVINGLDLGAPVTLISEAVFARTLSSQKDFRDQAAKVLVSGAKKDTISADYKNKFLKDLQDAVYASKIISYAQGFVLLREAAREFKWNLNYGGIALMWRGGCIIRSKFLIKIFDAFTKNPQLPNLLLDDFFKDKILKAEKGWRNVVAMATLRGHAVPAFSSALAYFDGIRTSKSAANLIQAQRDYFGAHTYERVDHPRGKYFHTNWTGRGGDTASSVYQV